MCHAASMNTGWRRLIGSPKLQIIFHKRATKYRSLLRKMTYKDKGSYESSPPCQSRQTGVRQYHGCFCTYVWIRHDIDKSKKIDLFRWAAWHIHECVMSHTWKTSCHTYECVMSHAHMNVSCHMHIWMCHVTRTYEYVMSHAHMNVSCHTHIWMCHVTRTYECVMPHAHMNVSCHTHIWMCHVTRTYERVMSHAHRSHSTYTRIYHTCMLWYAHISHIYDWYANIL